MPAEEKAIHQTLEQARYRVAYELVFKTKGNMADFSRYATLVKGFPATIINNGLGQALAFLFAKKKENNAEYHLLNHLELWLTKSKSNCDCGCFLPPYNIDYGPGKLLEAIREGDSSSYIQATLEALAILNYLRRVAAGLDEKRENTDHEVTQGSGTHEKEKTPAP